MGLNWGMASFKDTIIRLLKNIVEQAEREKKAAELKTLSSQTKDLPPVAAAEVELVSPACPEATAEVITEAVTTSATNDSASLHNLLHKGKDSLSTRFLAGSCIEFALPPLTLAVSDNHKQIRDPNYAGAELDSTWHHLEPAESANAAEPALLVDPANALLPEQSAADKVARAARIITRDNQTRLYSGSSEGEPNLLAAQWQCTPDHTLASESSPNEESFKNAAENISTSPATLAWLSSLVSPEVRASVASNEKTPPETLRKLANDVDSSVRLSVASNLSTPIDVLRTLTRDTSKLAASEAQSALSARGDVVEAQRNSHNLLFNNRFNPTSNQITASYTTLDAVAPGGLNDGSKADSEWQSLNTDGAKQAYIQQKDTVKDLKFNASVNSNGPRKPLPSYHAAFDKPPEGASPAEVNAFYKMVATRLSTPPGKLLELAASESVEVRAAVAENLNAPMEAFILLAKDSQAQVKLRVIDNCNCPSQVLEDLKEDQDPYVGYEAKNQLKRLQNIATQERSANHSLEGLL